MKVDHIYTFTVNLDHVGTQCFQRTQQCVTVLEAKGICNVPSLCVPPLFGKKFGRKTLLPKFFVIFALLLKIKAQFPL